MADPLETSSSLACVTVPNLVAKGQTLWAYYGVWVLKVWGTLRRSPLVTGRGKPLEMLRSPVSVIVQNVVTGHSRSNDTTGTTRIDRLPITETDFKRNLRGNITY